ncbi:hypothetical protein [Candidatus Ruminimicrobiellum ovillum]|uniref:hypothetical protein n=1 Tax=Candidatus Ruminimicrobiellum ovillum TaxID=1947927 RepID=UPI003559D6D3
MKIEELKKKLSAMGVPNRYYAINTSYLSNTYVLQKNYNKWEFFCTDERGGKNDYKTFIKEEDACEYMLEALKREMEV